MNITRFLLLAVLLSPPIAFAGEEMSTGKYMKQMTVTDEPLFKDRELQFGDYGIYSDGKGPAHVGLFCDHALGEGG